MKFSMRKKESVVPNRGRQGFEYDSFFQLNPLPMLIYRNSDLKILDVNSAAQANYGYSRDEFLSMTIEDIRPPEDVTKLQKMLKHNDSASRVTGYWRHKRKDGSIIFVEVYSHKIDFPPFEDSRVVTIFNVTKRKTAEENLIQSEQRFRDLSELLPQIVFEIDLNGNLLYCNRIAFDTFQYSYDTPLNSINIYNLVLPQQIDTVKNNLQKILSGEKTENREYLLYKKDGTSFPAIILISTILRVGTPIGFRGVIIDVSEIKNVQKELLYSHMKYSSLFENAFSIMLIIDPETKKIVDANNAAADFYGYSLKVIKQLSLKDLSTQSESDLNELIAQAINFKQNQFIRHHKLADGSYRFVEVFTSPIFIDGKKYLFSVIHNIDDRVLRDAKLKKLNKAIEQSPVSTVITDRDGIIEYVNPKFCEVTGYSYEEVIGKNPKILKSGEHNKGYYKDLWKTISSGKNWYGEFKNQKKNGSYYWESASISPLLDDKGNITHFVAIKEDITEKKMREEELERAKESAEESNRLKSNFLANMSHELRTPLVGILGYADILSSELSEGEYKEMALTILQSGHQLIETLNSILDLSRIESNQNEIDIRTLDLKEIIFESQSLFKTVAKSKGIYLKIDIKSNDLMVDADSHLLSKIFNNLINNAIKFTSEGGITISSIIENEDGNYFVRTDVSDTGIGIPADQLDIIFEPFRQASEGLSRNYSGTGLGLTLTKRFVDLLNGTISVKSIVGIGSIFTVRFPLAIDVNQADTELEIPPEMEELKINNRPSILLVEDDIVNAQIIIAYLKQNFEIDHVLDGQLGIEKCKSNNYDLILMDIALKGISGTTAMLEIKKLNDHYLQIPIIAITAFAMLGDKESFLKAGFSHYISKPFTRDQLFKVLTEIFQKPAN